jgi:Holliday junction resolvase RusA-like endonuclease
MSAVEAGITVNAVSFTLPMCPPSVNSLYVVRFKEPNPADRVKLRPECARWKTDSKLYVPRFTIAEGSIVRIDRLYAYTWFTKRGQWVKRDSFNMDKLLMDAIAEKTGIDDRRFKEGMMRSVNAAVERTEVTLTEITMGEWSR